MGFQGQLASVNLTDIFQTLTMNRQTGTLTVTLPDDRLHLYFEGGQISRCTAPVVDGKPFLLHALARRGLLAPEQVEDLINRLRDTAHPLRELVLASGYVGQQELDEVLAWCIEERVCPLFEGKDGEFAFLDGQPTQELLASDTLAMGEVKLQTTSLVLEATRRGDEWKRIREVIPDDQALYTVDNDGRANLKTLESDAEMLKVLRYLDGRHTIDDISSATGVSRFDAFAIVAQLVLAQVARMRGPQEMVDDALALRAQGDLEKAAELLEAILQQAKVPEVLRPLAEICVETKQTSRAVELYLELIQAGQDAGALEQALSDLETVLKLSPNDPDLHFDRAQILADLGRDQDSAAAFVSAAHAYLQTKDVPQAVDACHRAKNLWPRAPEPHRYLARAYLMEGQTDNALIEYKSLWHALLSTMTPRKALEELRRTLDAECKFAIVKEQVLAHAQTSEAVKTASAARMLIYAVLVIVLAAGGVIGWQYLNSHLFQQKAEQKVVAFRQDVPRRMASLEHDRVLDELAEIGHDVAPYPSLVTMVDATKQEVLDDLRRRLNAQLETATKYRDNGQMAKALEAYQDVKTHATAVPDLRDLAVRGVSDVQTAIVQAELAPQLDDIERQWTEALAWEPSIEKLKLIVARADLPDTVRDPLKQKLAKRLEMLDSAEQMYRRGEKLRQRNEKLTSIDVFRAAVKGKGDQWCERARTVLAELEGEIGGEIGERIRSLLASGNEQEAFAQLDHLRDLAAKASNANVQDYLAKFELPFVLQLADPHVEVLVDGKRVAMPAGTTGAWSVPVKYPALGKVAVEARRKGFVAQRLTVSADARKAGATIALKRGPAWRAEFGAGHDVGAAPTSLGQLIIAGTRKPSLELIDAGIGTVKEINFPNTLGRFEATPMIYNGLAYAVLDDRVICIDVNTRTPQWSYPDGANPGLVELNAASLLVGESDLNLGHAEVFVGSGRGKLVALRVDTDSVVATPAIDLEAPITGGCFVDHNGASSTLYVPTTNGLNAYDPSEISDAAGPPKRWILPTQREVVGRPARAQAVGRAAILIADAGGQVIAVDADPSVADAKRVVASWPAGDTLASGPVVDAAGTTAYVAVAAGGDGHIVALDLGHSGLLRWKYPTMGAIGVVAGTPVIGAHGIYAADANGKLYCIDAATGKERWQADLGASASGGILAHDGHIYVPTAGGSLSCFEEGDE